MRLEIIMSATIEKVKLTTAPYGRNALTVPTVGAQYGRHRCEKLDKHE